MKNKIQLGMLGFSLIEVMVAFGILAFVGLVVSTQTAQFSNFFLKTRKAVEQDLDTMISYKTMIRDLETSYFMKMGYINCGNSKSVMATIKNGLFQFSPSNSEFDLFGIDFTSVGGLSSDGRFVIVSDTGQLRLGDYIVLSLSGEFKFASLFSIKEIDKAKNGIHLVPAVFSATGFNCEGFFVTRSMLDFFGPSIRSNVLVSRIQPVKLKLEGTDLKRIQVYPSVTSQILFTNVSKLEIASKWRNFSQNQANLLEGAMDFEVRLEFESNTVVKDVSSRSGLQTFNARYVLGSVNATNTYAIKGAPSATVVFPSCSVNHEFRNQIMRIHPRNDWWRNMSTLVLKAQVSSSQVVGASITVSFIPQVGAQISCFLHDPEISGPYPSGQGLVEFPGEQSTITLAQGASGFDVYTCAARGTVDVQASMSYFDTQINQIKNIQCSAEPITASTKFRFSNNRRPWCKNYDKGPGSSKRWRAEFGAEGKVVGFDQLSTFGHFSVNKSNGCEFEGDPDMRDEGIASDCDKSEGKKLRRIYLRPYRVDVYEKDSKTRLFTKSKGAYVDCD
jgi:hypothetical protein